MKVFKFAGKLVKPFVNFPMWMGWKQISTTGRDLKDLAKAVLFREKREKTEPETFEQAVTRLNLDEKAIMQRQKQFLKVAIFYFLSGLALIIYSIYLFCSTYYVLPSFMTLILSALMFTYAYRQHFWYFQMKSRKLGCTFKEWAAFTLKGIKR